ncbi:MAG: YeeE/YedE family protein [Steroidobacteraceae bacterium]
MAAHVLVASTLGGMLIGSAAALLMLWNGQIAGISGIVDRVLHGAFGAQAWRLAFLVGLVLPSAWLAWQGRNAVQVAGSWPLLVIAGLLVGFGTRLGGGCTSGHGVCGLSAGSRRSLLATLVFMATAVVTVWLVRHAGAS